ncbi:MAG: hypothetical protein ACUVQG_08940 [Thermogutta sp.]
MSLQDLPAQIITNAACSNLVSHMKEILGPRRSGRSLRAEIVWGKHNWHWTLSGTALLFSGEWVTRVTCDGRELLPRTPWREVCRFDDRQVRHREYEQRLTGGVRYQRQITLCPSDNLVILGEAFLSSRSTAWEYVSRLKLAPGVCLSAASKTHEYQMAAGISDGVILPLALPEWKVPGETSGLVTEDSHLIARYVTTGRSFFFPLCLVLWKKERQSADQAVSADRSGGKMPTVTWRELTVSECLHKAPPDEAVAYRIQVEDRQWLFYRSLTAPANRAVLGHNLISESLLARFTTRGQVIPLVEVELAEEGAADER